MSGNNEYASTDEMLPAPFVELQEQFGRCVRCLCVSASFLMCSGHETHSVCEMCIIDLPSPPLCPKCNTSLGINCIVHAVSKCIAEVWPAVKPVVCPNNCGVAYNNDNAALHSAICFRRPVVIPLFTASAYTLCTSGPLAYLARLHNIDEKNIIIINAKDSRYNIPLPSAPFLMCYRSTCLMCEPQFGRIRVVFCIGHSSLSMSFIDSETKREPQRKLRFYKISVKEAESRTFKAKIPTKPRAVFIKHKSGQYSEQDLSEKRTMSYAMGNDLNTQVIKTLARLFGVKEQNMLDLNGNFATLNFFPEADFLDREKTDGTFRSTNTVYLIYDIKKQICIKYHDGCFLCIFALLNHYLKLHIPGNEPVHLIVPSVPGAQCVRLDAEYGDKIGHCIVSGSYTSIVSPCALRLQPYMQRNYTTQEFYSHMGLPAYGMSRSLCDSLYNSRHTMASSHTPGDQCYVNDSVVCTWLLRINQEDGCLPFMTIYVPSKHVEFVCIACQQRFCKHGELAHHLGDIVSSSKLLDDSVMFNVVAEQKVLVDVVVGSAPRKQKKVTLRSYMQDTWSRKPLLAQSQQVRETSFVKRAQRARTQQSESSAAGQRTNHTYSSPERNKQYTLDSEYLFKKLKELKYT